jgi:hypothetical protein
MRTQSAQSEAVRSRIRANRIGLAIVASMLVGVGVAQADDGSPEGAVGAEPGVIAAAPALPEPDQEVVLVLGGAISTVTFVQDPPPPTIRTIEWDPGAPSPIREHGWDPSRPSRIRTVEWDPGAPLRSSVRAPSAAEPSRIRTIEWNPGAVSRIRVHGAY